MSHNVKKQYIAVTVGPIFETMSLVSSPAALWASSYMFSYLSGTICELLCENGVAETDIITPYYSKTDSVLFDKKDGVGMFHDRVIFLAENFEMKKFKEIKEKALRKLSDVFEIDADYLRQYIQIAAVAYEAENPIFGCDKILNSRELEKPFVAQDSSQALLELLFGGEKRANERIKDIARKLGIYDRWQLSDGSRIKDINMIVNPNPKEAPKRKKHCYYAIVRSDGDYMSKIIASLDGEENFRSFSRDCLSYCSAIADEVAKFGGVTVYAGGDDLLAVLPCESKDGKSVFEFIASANAIFKKQFEGYGKDTSLSYGVVMCYKSFPLYEALEESAGLLFGVAKQKDHKNCTAVRLQKHAGQSEGLLIPNTALDAFLALKNIIAQAEDGKEDENDRVIVSALHKLSLFERLLRLTDSKEAAVTLFENIFDSGEQQTEFLHRTLPEFYFRLTKDLKLRAVTDGGAEDDPVTALCYILRILKFFNEKAGERE